MPYQNIDASLSTTDEKAVRDSFAAILAKLPFLVTLTPAERKGGIKTGSDSVSFVQAALEGALSNKDVVPASFNTAGFQRDVELFTVLTQLSTLAASIASQIDDTRLAVGGEAMQQATQIYNYVKTAGKTTPGLKPLAEQLGVRFKKTTRKSTPAAKP